MPKRSRVNYEGFFQGLVLSSSDTSGDDEEETKLTTPSGEEETKLTNSPGWNIVENPKSVVKEESPTIVLGKMGKKIFDKICKEGGLDEFQISMKDRDEEYIKFLIIEIEEYIDLLSLSMNIVDNTWSSNHIYRQDICSEHIDHCHNETRCRKISGFRTEENPRGFIPQTYHILQDYGFFSSYLGIDNISSKMPLSELEDWYVDFGTEIGMNLYKYGKKPVIMFLDMMMGRLRRVQFLRSFETHCCNGLERADDSHLPIDKALERIYQTILRKKHYYES